jgi:alpha-tubulin suppressor-like RCC1 family protein
VNGGALYCWGSNTFGELGIAPSGGGATVPTLVDSTSGFDTVAAGTFSTCGTTSSSALRCWGSNTFGALGIRGTFTHPYPLTTVEPDGWQTVSTGERAFCGIRGGALYCWGQNENGVLGHDENLVPGAVATHADDGR